MSGQDQATLQGFFSDLHSANSIAEWRGSWAISLLYRRPGIMVAWWVSHTALSPASLTFIGLALAVTMPLQAAFLPLWAAPWCVALTGALYQVLDCADGTLARRTGRVSKRGGDLDFVADMAQWVLLYAAIGLIADRTLGTGFAWTALALGAASGRLLGRLIRDRLNGNDASTREHRPIQGPWPLLVASISGLAGLLPFLALAGPALPFAVWFLLIYALLDIGDALAPLLNQ